MSTTPAINEINFETESFSIFCLDAIGLQHSTHLWNDFFSKNFISRSRQKDIHPSVISLVKLTLAIIKHWRR